MGKGGGGGGQESKDGQEDPEGRTILEQDGKGGGVAARRPEGKESRTELDGDTFRELKRGRSDQRLTYLHEDQDQRENSKVAENSKWRKRTRIDEAGPC